MASITIAFIIIIVVVVVVAIFIVFLVVNVIAVVVILQILIYFYYINVITFIILIVLTIDMFCYFDHLRSNNRHCCHQSLNFYYSAIITILIVKYFAVYLADAQYITLNVICVGTLGVYIDGYNQTPFNITTLQNQSVYSYLVKDTANLIGIQCLNSNGTGAIIAQTGTGFASNRSWKVAVGITDPDWTTACYDDRQWLYPVNINNPTWPQLSNATWITYPGAYMFNNGIYYRALIRK